ncbi:hypothetical protein Taro_047405 [Colocasia esculenta]|uniref:Uncharacterized protein n=1 Tax=Colocasia esculenta TaxID=4460 RepID=A0A843WSU4_COLES|nr:hypothetical protein [Colocasia esculenta]
MAGGSDSCLWVCSRLWRARGWGTDTSRRTGPQLVLFLVPHFRELGQESLKVSGLGLQLCSLQVWCWFVSTVFDLVELKRQLDLSAVAASLRGEGEQKGSRPSSSSGQHRSGVGPSSPAE